MNEVRLSRLASEGLSGPDNRSMWIRRRMLGQARRGVLPVDSLKFELTRFEVICLLGDLDDRGSEGRRRPRCAARAAADIQLRVARGFRRRRPANAS